MGIIKSKVLGALSTIIILAALCFFTFGLYLGEISKGPEDDH